MDAISIKKKPLATLAVLVVAGVVVVLVVISIVRPISDDFRTYLDSVAMRQTLLLDMRSAFGYGAAIHAFRNYVPRGESRYREPFDRSYAVIVEHINAYREIPGPTPAEGEAVDAVARMQVSYNADIERVGELRRLGMSPLQIDALVKTDDGPAIAAFDVLNRHYTTMTRNYADRLQRNTGNLLAGVIAVVLFGILPVTAAGGMSTDGTSADDEVNLF